MLSVEEFAKISAEIAAGTPRDKALSRAGISTADWLEHQKGYLAKMAREAGSAERETSARYWAVFTARRREVELEKASMAAEPAPPASSGPPPVPPPPPRAEAPLGAPFSPERAAPAITSKPPALFEIDDDATSTFVGEPSGAEAAGSSLPFVAGQPSFPPPAPRPASVPEDPRGLPRSSTLAVVTLSSSPARPATLPFPRAAADPRAAPVPTATPASPPSQAASAMVALAAMPAPRTRPSSSAPAVRLRLDQFAALMARQIAQPERAAQAFAAAGLDPEMAKAESHAWFVRCCQDWQLLSHFYASVQHELGRLRSEAPGEG